MDNYRFVSAGSPARINADAIRRLRRNGGWTMSGFAQWMGVTRQTVSNWENGRFPLKGPALRVLQLIEEASAARLPPPPPMGPFWTTPRRG